MRFAVIAKHRGIWPLAWLCATLQVTRGGFYAWLKRPESDRTYGARRVRRDLRDWGHPCGLHRVERLMRRAQLVARAQERAAPSLRPGQPVHQ